MVYRASVYRLYPTKSQEARLESVRETCRRFYNACLAERKTAYAETKETIGKYAQLRKVKELKATNPYAKEVHSHILQVVVDDLDKAFAHSFGGSRRATHLAIHALRGAIALPVSA